MLDRRKVNEIHDVMQMNREASSGNTIKYGEPNNCFSQEAK